MGHPVHQVAVAPGAGGRYVGGALRSTGPCLSPWFPTLSSRPMSYATYKVIHYLGIFLLVVALGAALGRRVASDGPDPLRKRFVAIHGVGLFLVLLGGFGLLARIGVSHGTLFPGWVWGKLVIWTVLGAVVILARRSPAWSMPLILLVPGLAALAGVLAFLKPF